MRQASRGCKTYDLSLKSLVQAGKLWLAGTLERLQWEGPSPSSIAGGSSFFLVARHSIHVQSTYIEINIQLIDIFLATAGKITLIPLSQLKRILFYIFVTVGKNFILFLCDSWGAGGEWSTVRSGLTDGLCLVDQLAPGQVCLLHHLAPGQGDTSQLSHYYNLYWYSNHFTAFKYALFSRSLSFRCTASGCSQQG